MATIENINFASTAEFERVLDGSDEAFRVYYFALYHLQPDEECDFNRFRDKVRSDYPSAVAQVGRYYVLWGEAAYQVVKSYYSALATQATLEVFREYAKRRLDSIAEKHRVSQSLPQPIDLSEGQLSGDAELEFYAHLAIGNRQVLNS